MHIISGHYKNRKLSTPGGLKTRPTSSRLRETLFNICQGYVEGARFLDLFAGSGAMGLEALSRGAAQATFVDNHKESIKSIYQNISLLKVESQTKVIYGDVFHLIDKLAKKGESYDIIYADPPYNSFTDDQIPFGEHILKQIDSSGLLTPSGDLFIEDASEIQLDDSMLSSLKSISVRHNGKAILHHYRRST